KLGYIFAVYILVLAAIPCCAFDSCPEDKLEAATDHSAGDEDCGSCSPFFSCEGCAVASVPFQASVWSLHPVENIPQHAEFLVTSLPSTYFDFWQPPRLG